MASKDDDTMPLSGFSEEHSTDTSVDEDVIPTTQPESSDSLKMSKNLESKLTNSSEEMKPPAINTKIEGLQLPEDRIDQFGHEEDKSVDFIPNTETKPITTTSAVEDISCKKKLPVFKAEESFKDQKNASWDFDMSKLPESPAVGNQSFSILCETPPNIPSSNGEIDTKRKESVTEIIVNDSADTVDLEQSPVKIKKSDSQKGDENLDVSCSLNSDVERCEETQLFDYSSVLMLDHQGSEKSERFRSVTPEESYMQETADDNLQNVEVSELPEKRTQEDMLKVNGNIFPDKEIHNSTTEVEQNSSPMVSRKIDFKLSVSCCLTLNTKTNKVLCKRILKVEEVKKPKPTFILEPASDSMTDTSKRHSTSSSGSVYSDKTGLPFALSKRVSAVSYQTDSSEEDLGLIRHEQQRRMNRTPWINEYLLPLKMDEIMQGAIENQESLKRIPKSRQDDKVNNLKQILESSSSETVPTSTELQLIKTDTSEETLVKEETGSLTLALPEEDKQSTEKLNRNDQSEDVAHVGSKRCSDTEEEARSEEPEPGQANSTDETGQVKRQTEVEDISSSGASVVLCEGLPVLARWTDKRYYSGVLCGSTKNDRWEVKFDDGASKFVRDDFIIPIRWLKVGALVFALKGDEYKSGQIVDVNEGRNGASYVVELDDEKKKVTVKISDLRFTEVMAGIIKEKYQPLGNTPKRKADIDFDNVLSGKRFREQKTPLQSRVERESSGGKKKSSSKTRKDNDAGLSEIDETPVRETRRTARGLQSENGHLVEDKIISAESPSGNETTPVRGNSKRTGLKPKPRSLFYDCEEMRSGRTTTKSYLRSDGTPIPGTSGVKFKKRKVNPKANNPETPPAKSEVRSSSKKNVAPSKASQSTDKSKRKRKLEESLQSSAQKADMKNETVKSKRKLRNL